MYVVFTKGFFCFYPIFGGQGSTYLEQLFKSVADKMKLIYKNNFDQYEHG